MRTRSILGSLVAVAALTGTTTANAVQQPAHAGAHGGLELATGTPVRSQAVLRWFQAPSSATKPWRALLSDLGPNTRAVWDRETHVPRRIWGEGIPAAGTMASPGTAAKFARLFLARHIALLAPGAAPSDFVLVSNDLSRGMRTIGFEQRHRGMPVLGGQVSFRFKSDRLFMIGSEALPYVDGAPPNIALKSSAARAAAESWVLSDSANVAKTVSVAGPFVLPIIEQRSVRFTTVMRVTVEADEPVGLWEVFVDAHSGQVVAREQTLRFGAGTLNYNVPERQPDTARLDYPAFLANVTVNNAGQTTTQTGGVSWTGNLATSVVATATGTYVDVNDSSGPEDTATLNMADAGTAVWNGSNDELIDAQVSVFVHTNQIIEFSRSFAGGLPYLNTQVDANVNIDNSCNAFYSPQNQTINFYTSNNNCHNTGQLADVVYHEYGHSLNRESIIQGVGAFEGALGEGVADFLASTFTGDSGMGRGFFKSNAPLRELNPTNSEWVWPDDIGEIHATGRIIGGALWDLRTLLMAKHGDTVGLQTTNVIFYEAMRRSTDIPTMYFEALAADDDNGNLDDGTPNICEINEAFGAHGLRRYVAQPSALDVEPPGLAGYDVTLALQGLYTQCPADGMPSAELEWRLRAQPSTGGTIDMAAVAAGFEGAIPAQEDGTVVQYQVRLSVGTNAVVTYPDNPADEWYQMFVGEVQEIYCTDFETDPEMEGWTHALTSGQSSEGADDWQWGEPNAAGGDPADSYSPSRVYGNDLGEGNFNGQYQGNKTNHALSPVVDTSGYDVVRLQYRRWLQVEDGFFDHANIYANESLLWTNFNSNDGDNSKRHHTDQEWRFQDIDVSNQAASGSVQIMYELDTDQGLHFGGWNIDDFCIVGWVPVVCGDERVAGSEECDDGDANSDSAADACRTDCTNARCGDGAVDSGEECDDGNDVEADGCELDCSVTPGSTGAGGGDGPAGSGPLIVDDGCGCEVVGQPSRGAGWQLLALLGAAGGIRRRRRR